MKFEYGNNVIHTNDPDREIHINISYDKNRHRYFATITSVRLENCGGGVVMNSVELPEGVRFVPLTMTYPRRSKKRDESAVYIANNDNDTRFCIEHYIDVLAKKSGVSTIYEKEAF